MTDGVSSDRRVLITREALRDGTLLALARAAMPPGTIMRSDAEIEADLDRTLVHHPPGADVWLFGYGSLMWNPAIHFVERRFEVSLDHLIRLDHGARRHAFARRHHQRAVA